ncbi:MAG: C39 family peptidase [Deltaproteobacteria bacterium]|nr:C39 family peptidase [Deltaproteobacteria bacterium]
MSRSTTPRSWSRLLLAAALMLPACAPAPGVTEDLPPLDEGPAVGEEYAAPEVVAEAADRCGEDCDILAASEVVEVPRADPETPEDDEEVEPDASAPSLGDDADDAALRSNDSDAVMLDGPVAGSTMVTRRYAGFHRHPSDASALLAVAPHGGVATDGRHPNPSPRGLVPPGKRVTLVQAAPQHGYLKVRFDGVTGWLKAAKLAWRDPSLSRVRFALQPSVRNAFFKHQILRSRWNKDGPTSSGNCAPTSLAMAANILGKERTGHSVEQSIHRVRHLYDGGLHEGEGTTRGEIYEAARELGLHVRGLGTDLSPAAALERVKRQLGAGRLVILQGQPGRPNHGPTTYERAFTRAYQAAIADGASLAHGSYNYDGRHSILVLGRDREGRYVVGDPISEVGFVALTGAELKDFMTRFTGQRGTGNAVWR